MRDDGKKSPAENFFEPADIRFGRDLFSGPDRGELGQDEHADLEYPTAEDDALYEEQILTRIGEILEQRGEYVSRTLKAGSFRRYPVAILGRPALPYSSTYLATPDALAHFLSADAERFAPLLGAAVDHIILLPEVVCTERFLLTHIHAPAARTLLVYLHPMRMNRARVLDLPERLGPGRRPGLFEDLIASLPENMTSARGGASNLHKYVLPLTELEANEIARMDQVQREYARKFQLDHELI